MPGTGAVVWSHQWSKGIDCAPLPNLPTRQVWGWMLLAGLIRGDQVLGFHSQAAMKWFFPDWLFFLHFQLNPHQQEPSSAWGSMKAPWQLRWQQRSGAGYFCREVGRGKLPAEKHFPVFLQSKRKTKSAFSPSRIRQTWWWVVETNHSPWPNSSKKWRAKGATRIWCLSGEKNLP